MQPITLRWLIPFSLVVLLLPGCGDSADDGAANTASATATSAAAPSTTTAPATTISNATAGSTELQGNSDPGVPAGVMTSIEGFNEAGLAYDTELMRTYLTDDFTWQSTGPVVDVDEYLAYVDAHWERMEFRWEATDEPVISLDGDVYVVDEPGVATEVGRTMVGTTVFRLTEVDGEWLIQEIRWVDDSASGSTE